MTGEKPDIQAIFFKAIELDAPEEISNYLDAACGGDQKVRAEIEVLLSSHREAGNFLGGSASASQATIDQPIREKPGQQIGPYKLLQQIGDGGMGVVYMAEQTEPVKRRVALKIIKPGMDTRQVIARFEAERQALAMMDHPNIAKVLDAGATDSGRPYFVMELVNGISVTQYCDDQHLTPKERLELFVPICQAVQHAHQKGIIHRDLKPSNVMVALYDDRPVPKVIDFGVAKATSQMLTEKTMFTQFGQIVGTLEYMSPEQAQRNQLDIDTRSDIYSLGVLLYELLTGDTPFDGQRLRSAAFDEMLRIIREEEPLKPSTKVSGSEALASIAANRKIEPAKLSILVRGELDWIVMKALEKDRGRRYATATSFAEDIQHYLHDEAVVACPPSARYRFGKFVRRNRSALVTTSIAATTLVTLTIVAAVAAARFQNLAKYNAALVVQKEAARNQEKNLRKQAERQTQVVEDALRDARQQRRRAENNLARARAAVDEFLNQVTTNELLSVPGLQPLRRDLLLSALEFYRDFATEKADDPALLVQLAAANYRIGRIQRELGQTEDGAESISDAVERFATLRDEGHDTLEVRSGLAHALYYLGRYEETLALCRLIRKTDEDNPEIMSLLSDSYNSLAIKAEQNYATALQYHREALPVRQELVDRFPDNARYIASVGSTLNNIGVLLSKQNQRREAQDMYRQATRYKARAYELAPHEIKWGTWLATGLRNEASLHRQRGLHELAIQGYQQVVDVQRKLVFDNPAVESLKGDLAKAWLDLGNYQRWLKKSTDADRSLRKVVDILEQMPRETPTQLFSLAAAYANLAVPPEDDSAAPEDDSAAPEDDSAAPEDERVDEADAFAAEQQARYARLAIETLNQAIDEGFADLEAFESSKPLQAIAEVEEHRPSLEHARDELRSAMALSKADGERSNSLTNRKPGLPLFREFIDTYPPEVRREITMASAAHSIGLLLMRLKGFAEAEESLQTAREIRMGLLARHPGDPQFRAELGGARIAMGSLLWQTDRLPEAIGEFGRGLELLDAASKAALDDAIIQQQVADWERRVFICYGELGLWAEAAEYARRNLALERVTDITWDARFALLLGLTGDVEGQRRYAQLIAESESPGAPLTMMASCTIPEPAMAEAELLTWAESVDVTKRGWRAMMAAIGHYRAGEYETALELVQLDPSSILNRYREYWLAMIYTRLGKQDEAEQSFVEAEANYRDLGELCVTKSSVADEFGELWERLIHTQLVRREAWQEVKGRQPPPDPWQHLIQARGYSLIGKIDQAESELAAAIAAAPNDANVRSVRAQLFARLGLHERVAGEWQAAFELAGDDPQPRMTRGCWNARRGEDELAAEDFRRAVKLAGAQQLWEVRAEALDRLGRWDEAIDDLNRGMQLQPDDTELLMKRAQLYSKTKQLQKAVDDLCKAQGSLSPAVMESGWTLIRSVIVPGAQAACFNPHDGRLYVGTRDTDSDGLYIIDDDHSIHRLAEGDRLFDIVVDPEDGTIFFSEDHHGLIYRIASGTEPREIWVSRFKSTDSDPCGMAIIPKSYGGTDFAPGDAIVLDRGWLGPDEIYRFSVHDPENAELLYSDKEGSGLLEDPLDVTVGRQHVYLADAANDGRIYQLSGDGTLTPVATKESLGRPVAIAADPNTEDLFVLDAAHKRLLRVDPQTGAVSEVAVDLAANWSSRLDLTPDGKQMAITVGDLMLVFSSTDDHRSVPSNERQQRLIDHYTGIIQRDSTNWLAFRVRGELYRETKQWEKAIGDWSAAIKGNPRDAYSYNARSICHCILQDFESALRDSNRAIEIDQQSWMYSHRAWPLTELSRYDEAIADCNQALKLDPNNATAMLRRGFAYKAVGKYDAGIEDFSRVINLQPDRSRSYLYRGRTYFSIKNYEAAIEDFSRAIELAPDSPLAHYPRANAYCKLQNYEAALADFNRAIELEPDAGSYYYARARLRIVDLGKNREGIADCDQALRLDPQLTDALLQRARAHARLGEHAAAIADAAEGLKRAPDSEFRRNVLAEVLSTSATSQTLEGFEELEEYLATVEGDAQKTQN